MSARSIPRRPAVLRSLADEVALLDAAGLSAMERARVLALGFVDAVEAHVRFAAFAGLERIVVVLPGAREVAQGRTRVRDGRFSFLTAEGLAGLAGSRFDAVWVECEPGGVEAPAPEELEPLVAEGGVLVVAGADDPLGAGPGVRDRRRREAARRLVRHAEAAGWAVLRSAAGFVGRRRPEGPSCERWALAEAPEPGEGAPIRKMTCDDLDSVMRLELASFPDPWTPLAYWLELRHNPGARYTVALRADGAVCGLLGWWLLLEGAALVHVAVDPLQRREGVGTQLWRQALRQAESEGCPRFSLEVRASNEGARRFYRRLGFEEAGREPGYYSRPCDDAIIMVKSLSGTAGSRGE